jgi:hypothetical protein
VHSLTEEKSFEYMGRYSASLNVILHAHVNKLPNFLCLQIMDGFKDGKDLAVTVMSAMGEEQICALKDVGPKN